MTATKECTKLKMTMNKGSLPVIGEEYEFKPYWNRVKIVAHDQADDGIRIVFWDRSGQRYDYSSRPHYFRPIRTAEQIAAIRISPGKGREA